MQSKLPKFLRIFIKNKIKWLVFIFIFLFASNDAFIVISFLPSNTNAYRSMSTLYAKKLSGGKTTSQMNPLKRFTGRRNSVTVEEDFQKLFDTIFRTFSLAGCPEITMEANPDDLTPEYIALLRRLPFNRISMGIQTFKRHL